MWQDTYLLQIVAFSYQMTHFLNNPHLCNNIYWPLCCRFSYRLRHSLALKREATLCIMLGYTTENMHFGLIGTGFAEAAVTQGRSLVSAADPGSVMTVNGRRHHPGHWLSTRFQLAYLFIVLIFIHFFFSFFFTSIVTVSYHVCPSCGKTGEPVDMEALCGCLFQQWPGEPSDDPVTYQGLPGSLLIDNWNRP